MAKQGAVCDDAFLVHPDATAVQVGVVAAAVAAVAAAAATVGCVRLAAVLAMSAAARSEVMVAMEVQIWWKSQMLPTGASHNHGVPPRPRRVEVKTQCLCLHGFLGRQTLHPKWILLQK